MHTKKIYDIIGIGIGPFNLGMAALCNDIPELKCLFIDKADGFDWHPGLMIPGTHLQIPFYADLVTLADPRSKFTYMAFLKAKKRLFRFGIHENYFVSRKEYNQYCQWITSQIPFLRFGYCCQVMSYDAKQKIYAIETNKDKFYGKHIVIGIGTVANIPAFAENLKSSNCFHSGDYLFHKKELLKKKSVTIIGSGQSAAEIFHDLLQVRHHFNGGLNWFTRSERFFPMEYSKLSLEMSTPDYIDHFYSLDVAMKKQILSRQGMLYKGINFSLINDIYDLLRSQDIDEIHSTVRLHTNCELQNIKIKRNNITLELHHNELNKSFNHVTANVIFATGFRNQLPSFLQSIHQQIKWDERGHYNVSRNYSIDCDNQVFVQNAEMHTHGFNAADLGLGPYRNAIILNRILGYSHFDIEKDICFQNFGMPKSGISSL
jgi:lysine N6-hydroxylase